MKQARWWMPRRWWPRTFAEYMATPAKIEQRDLMIAMCDAISADSVMGARGVRGPCSEEEDEECE